MSNEDSNHLVCFIGGMAIMLAVWFGMCKIVEQDKVNSGYLTYENKIYSVTLEIDLNEVRDATIAVIKERE